MTLRVVLTRHGETEWNRQGRIQGWAPVALTDRGRQQARTLGEALAREYDVDRLVASDLRRTRETSALLVDSGVDADPTFDAAWRERDIGAFQGFSREDIAEFPALSGPGVDALRERPPGGESLLDVRERVLDAFESLCEHEDGTAVVVTHGGPLAILLGHLDGEDLVEAVWTNSLENCSLTEVVVDDAVDIRRRNETVQAASADD